jgi:cell division protein FtsL
MATTAASFPGASRRPRNQPVAGRASYPDIYFVKHIDNSRLKREVDFEKRRECFSLLGLGGLVFFFIFLFAWQHFQCVRYGYQIEQLKRQQTAMEEWNHTLKLECASLDDPQRIDLLARSKLGLVPPQPGQIIQVGGAPGSVSEPSDPEFAANIHAPMGILKQNK